MRQSSFINPANGIVFVHGHPDPCWPQPIWGGQVLATTTALSVCCMPEVDGPTELILGDAADVGHEGEVHYEGTLLTPDRLIQVTDVPGAVLLKMPVPEVSHIKIWRSHPRWPERVAISVDRAAASSRMERAGNVTVAILPAFNPISRFAIIDGTVPSRHRDFNAWLHPDILQTGLMFEASGAGDLVVEADSLPDHSARPQIDGIIATPSGEVQLFGDPPGRAVLKAGVLAAQTRVQASIELYQGRMRTRVVLSAV